MPIIIFPKLIAAYNSLSQNINSLYLSHFLASCRHAKSRESSVRIVCLLYEISAVDPFSVQRVESFAAHKHYL